MGTGLGVVCDGYEKQRVSSANCYWRLNDHKHNAANHLSARGHDEATRLRDLNNAVLIWWRRQERELILPQTRSNVRP